MSGGAISVGRSKKIHPCPNFIGLQIKYMRKIKKITQRELSLSSGIKLRHLQNIEYGHVDIKLRTLGQIALGLGITPQLLLTPTQNNRQAMCSECQHMLPNNEGALIQRRE